MIVCSCNQVSDREIRSAAERGATTPREVARHCAAGADCGGCIRTVRTLLEEFHAEQQPDGEPALFETAGLSVAS